MSHPWLDIPLGDYEGHMSSADVGQLAVLAELFKRALDYGRPESVAVVGVAGGNGLDQIDRSITKRIVGVDINQQYLDEVRRRFGAFEGLELYCRNLSEPGFSLAPVAMTHAALIFEHTGLGIAFENALSLVAPGGMLSVVLQLPSVEEQSVSSTKYESLQGLSQHFSFIDVNEFQRLLESKGFRRVEQETRSLPRGKAFWFGVFQQIKRL